MINLSLSVLDHATPSFVETSFQSGLHYDFGVVDQGSVATTGFDIFNLVSTAGYTARLEMDSVDGVGNTAVFATDLMPFTGVNALPAGSGNMFTASMDTSVLGAFSATYTLGFSDEDLAGAIALADLVLTLTGSVTSLACDFDGSGACDIADLNSMLSVGPVAPGLPAAGNEQFDLDGSGTIDNADVDEWLLLAATDNGFSGPYLHGDADLNGVVDFLDFNSWASHRFQGHLRWDHGDFDGSGVVDFLDFNRWATNRFQSTPMLVPEPATWILWACGLVCSAGRRTRREPRDRARRGSGFRSD